MKTHYRIAIGLSGGVDSSVSAYLLKQQGHEVIAIYMNNWHEENDMTFCQAEDDINCCEQVCQRIGIPFYIIDKSQDYWDHVFAHFLHEYRLGRTPNPDILCNRWLKFESFWHHAQTLGCDKMATGHYAGIRHHQQRYELHRARDRHKDQSYFLHQLTAQQLANSCFPLADWPKSAVRQLAEELGLANAKRPDSTGICFIGERQLRPFLQRYLPQVPGDILDEHGHVIGQHEGISFYTIGQRQGLKIGGRQQGHSLPWYIVDKQIDQNQLICVQGDTHPLRYRNQVYVEKMHWINHAPSLPHDHMTAQVRHGSQTTACQIKPQQEQWEIHFAEPQLALAPGQYVALYQQDVCLGGGVMAWRPTVVPTSTAAG